MGPGAFKQVVQASSQIVEMASAAGWACRHQGLYTGDHERAETGGKSGSQQYGFTETGGFVKGPRPADDHDLDDWLARRHGKPNGATRVPSQGPGGSSKRALSLENRLPPTAMRAGDSPRTASWRAAVAIQTPGALLGGARDRSGSPDLDDWLESRAKAKGATLAGSEERAGRASSLDLPRSREEKRSRRAASQPPGHASDEFTGLTFTLPKFCRPDEDRRAWAEILEEEQAQEAECEEDLFQELRKEERKRLAQVERAQ